MTLLKSTFAALATFRARHPRTATLAALAALALLVLPAASACSKSSESTSAAAGTSSGTGPVVARVNGVDIHESDLAMAEEDLGDNIHNMDPATKREQLISYVSDIILLGQEAEKHDLQKQDEFKQREAFLHKKLLMGMMLQSLAKTAITDEALHQVYDQAMKSMAGEEEVHARHILVSTEEEAKAIVDQLKAGADFATLAKEKSKDPSGKNNGGDLGYFTKAQMVPEFAEVAFKMYPGQISNPVKTQFGWHVIKVEDKRKKEPPSFDSVKPQLEAFVVRKAQNDLVAQLREKAKIERLDKPAADAGAKPSPAPATPGAPGSQPQQQ
jgi:peptidyl-prolyl cis-trans isomerase C